MNATYAINRQAPREISVQPARGHGMPAEAFPKREVGARSPFPGASWLPWIFAAKTTASGLIAFLVAFTFNLDQPYWALLTVFIVSQPQQSGLVLAKSF